MFLRKKLVILVILSILGLNLNAQESGYTLKPFFGGGGFDFFYYGTGSIYLEAGYLQHYLNNELIGGVSIGIGTRGFFR